MQKDILYRMQQQIDTWHRQDDRRAIFLECYCMMTGNMLRAITNGQFHDGDWARRLLHRFADYYFLALEDYDCGDDCCAEVWRFTHDCACSRPLHVLQHLLLGINAHINYDLVLALVDTLEPEWPILDKPGRHRRYQDHCHVNRVIAATVDQVQDEIIERYDPRLDWIDRLLGRLDERLLSGLISRWRQQVWDTSLKFLKAPAGQREALRLKLASEVMQRAQRIVNPI